MRSRVIKAIPFVFLGFLLVERGPLFFEKHSTASLPSVALSYVVKNTTELLKSDDLIFETEYWRVFLSSKQYFLGRSTLRLKRLSPSLTSDLTAEEQLDFFKALRLFDEATKQAFGSEVINFSCQMNNGLEVTPPIAYAHCHLRPRYRYPVKFLGKVFVDKYFGRRSEDSEDIFLSPDERSQVILAIRHHLPHLEKQ